MGDSTGASTGTGTGTVGTRLTRASMRLYAPLGGLYVSKRLVISSCLDFPKHCN